MSLPTIQDTINGFTYEWAEEQLKVEVSRLHDHSRDGTITGELLISTTAPGAPPHLHQANFNFSASTTRTQLAKLLATRYAEPDWYAVLEQVCVYTLDRIRKGEPVVELWAGDEIEPPVYLLPPLVVQNQPNAIFGAPGAAKSTVALILSQIMVLPWRENPIGLVAPAHPVSCLYLDWETDKATVLWQLTMLGRGMQLPAVIQYRHCAVPLAQDLEQIRKWIVDTKSELIIIDSLGLACGGELKEAEPALKFFAAFRQLRTTALILAHTSKDRESKTKSIYGSVYFEAGMRNIWEIAKRQEPEDDDMDIALFHRKPPPFAKLSQPIGLHISYDGDKMIVGQGQPQTVGEFVERMGIQTQIMNFLKDGPRSPLDIAANLEIKDANCRNALSRLKAQGRIVKLADKYGLASHG